MTRCWQNNAYLRDQASLTFVRGDDTGQRKPNVRMRGQVDRRAHGL
jgi:hypothetical protein